MLRHHRQMETVSRLVLTIQCPVCLAVYGDRKAAHRHLLSSLRRGSCRDRSRYLGQVLIPQSLCCPVCSAEPGNWSELQLHLAEHLSSVFNGFRNAGLGGNASRKRLRKARVGERVKQAVAEGGSEREVLRRLVDVLATLSLVNAAELRDLTSTVRKTWPKQWQRQVGSTTTPLAQSRTSPKQSAQTLKSNSVPFSCTCGQRSCAAWPRRRSWEQNTWQF